MVTKRFYNIEELSIILGKSIASIHGHLARKQFDAVPPPIKLGRRLAWQVESVNEWIDTKASQATPWKPTSPAQPAPPARRRGRPKKTEQRDRGEK
uniref:Putative transcriptional regulator n=1 Tax=Desulfovibrio sp. U5L TaxID=596152 RepID=I2Q0Z9_9BACT